MRRGLTLTEVLVALVLLGVTMLALEALLVQSLRRTQGSGQKTQAVQILNYLGRRIVEGDARLLVGRGEGRAYGYGTLKTAFRELPSEVHLRNPANLDLYRAEVRGEGAPQRVAGLGLQLYRIRVCWREGREERCTEALTYAPPASGERVPPPLPGVN